MGNYLAVDLGASNGRVMLGRFDGQKLKLEEINRFETHYTRIQDAYYWDVVRLYKHIVDGIRLYARKYDEPLLGIGIDTWGVDFALLDKQGRLIGNPRAYRDPRTQRGKHSFYEKYGEQILFELTGIANLDFNTVFQLFDMANTGDPQLKIADKLLLMPDLFGYMLCGEMSNEYTHASTTQMLDKDTGSWSKKIADMVGIPVGMFAPIAMSGTVKGYLHDFIREDAGLKNAPPVFNVGGHDTASAVASIPIKDENFAFISSGTWSLIGIFSDHVIINEEMFENQFSNEGTVDGRYRPLRNIMGLWIIQNCKREWDRQSPMSWDEVVAQVAQTQPFQSFIDVDAPDFFDGDGMTRKIQNFCGATGQRVPQTIGEIARTVYESLAMSYRDAFAGLEKIKGRRVNVMHIVGGGAKNALLNQFAANALNREVVAGPYEATAIGNLIVQIKAAGEVESGAALSRVIRDSFEVEIFMPKDTKLWAEQYQRYVDIKNRERQ